MSRPPLHPPATQVRCPVCAMPVAGSERRCERCDTPHHQDCWNYLGGCAIFGCDPRGWAPGATPADADAATARVALWLYYFTWQWRCLLGTLLFLWLGFFILVLGLAAEELLRVPMFHPFFYVVPLVGSAVSALAYLVLTVPELLNRMRLAALSDVTKPLPAGLPGRVDASLVGGLVRRALPWAVVTGLLSYALAVAAILHHSGLAAEVFGVAVGVPLFLVLPFHLLSLTLGDREVFMLTLRNRLELTRGVLARKRKG